MKKPRNITVTVSENGTLFEVAEGGRSADMLCWEEMLGQVATLTHHEIRGPRFEMLTKAERIAREERWSQRTKS